jgi:hypothetical protein
MLLKTTNRRQLEQLILAIGLILKIVCICDVLANPKIGLNLVENPL